MLRYSDKTIGKRGRPIRNIDFIKALKRQSGFDGLEPTYFSSTVAKGIKNIDKAEKYASAFRTEFGIDCSAEELMGTKSVRIETKIQVINE
jgi:hypothetical protein